MRSLLFTSLFFCFSICPVLGQTARELGKKYLSNEFLEVRPNILMKAEYSASGEVCSLFFQPNHYSVTEKTVFVGNSTIDLYDLLEVLDEMAPAETRKGKGLSMGSIIQGGMESGGFMFENVNFNFKRGFIQKGNGRTIQDGTSDNAGLVDYLNSFGSPESASIRWTKRVGCGESK